MRKNLDNTPHIKALRDAVLARGSYKEFADMVQAEGGKKFTLQMLYTIFHRQRVFTKHLAAISKVSGIDVADLAPEIFRK